MLRRGLFLECRVTHKNKNWRRCGLNCPFTQAIKVFGQNHEEDDGDDDSYKVLGERYYLLFAMLAKSLGTAVRKCVWLNKLAPKFQKQARTLII